MAEVAEILKQARALIEDPERWHQGYYARTEDGRVVDAYDPDACAWCAEGAVLKAGGSLFENAPESILLDACAVDIAATLDLDYAVMFANHLNDQTDHATVLRMFDCAIAKAEANG